MKFARLGEVADFRAGFGFPIIHQGLSDGDYPFAKVGDISEVVRRGQNTISTTPNYITTETLKKIHAKALPPGSIVFAKIGEAIRQNFRAITATDMVVDNNVMGMVPDSSQIDTMYLFQFMKQLDLYQFATATSVPALRKSRLEEIPIPLPPLPEQRRIAAVLDAADALRAKRRAALGKLDALLQSVFLEMFGDPVRNERGWEVRPLGQVMTEIYRYPTYYDITYEEDGIPEIRGELISGDGNIISEPNRLRFISPQTSAKFPRTVLAEADLVMSVRGTIGKIGRVPPGLAGANMTANLIRLAPDRAIIEPVYAWYFMRTNYFKSKLIGASSSTTIQTIRAPELKAIPVLLPPMSRQQNFVRRVLTIEKIRAQQQGWDNEANEFFASLQQRAFRGEL